MPEYDVDQLIALNYSDAALQMGSAVVPLLYRRFWPYLRGLDGERLDPRESYFLEYILAEMTGEERPTFHLRQLPCPFAQEARRQYAMKFRRMGIVYTKPFYKFDRSGGVTRNKPPVRRIDHVEWILEPLFYNLSIIYQAWEQGRAKSRGQFGNPRNKVIYRLPDTYTHTVVVPPTLLKEVASGKLNLNPRLIQEAKSARAQVEQSPLLDNLPRGVDSTLVGKTEDLPRGVDSTHVGNKNLPRGVESTRVGIENQPRGVDSTLGIRTTSTISAIAKIFAEAIGIETYKPSERDLSQIEKLLADGITLEQISDGVADAVKYAKSPVRTFSYCVPAIYKMRDRPTAELSDSRLTNAAEKGTPEPTAEAGKPLAESVPTNEQSNDSSHLKNLVSGDLELLAVLTLVQEHCERPLKKSDVTTWAKLRDDTLVVELAAKRQQTPIAVVQAAVLEAISAGSVKQDFFAANLARRILETWSENGNGPTPPRPRNGNSRSGKTQPSSANALAEYERGLEDQIEQLKKGNK